MSEAYIQLMSEHRRLAILRALASPDSGGKVNDSILHTIVVSSGINSSRDQVKTALFWLREQELVTLDTLTSGTLVGGITQRGLDVAAGNTSVPGVQRPAPGN